MPVQSDRPRQSVSLTSRVLCGLSAAALLSGCPDDPEQSVVADTSATADVVPGDAQAGEDATAEDANAADATALGDALGDATDDTSATADVAPALPEYAPLPTPLAACPAPPLAMATFPEDTKRIATAVYHFNIQYVAGGLDNYLDVYTVSEEELEDAIIRESFEPIVALFEKHPTWGTSFEMQGLMLEIMAERHPDVLDRLRTLAARGQVDVMSYHYSDQLVTAYPRRDMEWSWAENQRIFDGLCMPRAPIHFLQEGQFGPGIQAFAAEHDELVILPRNLMKLFHNPPPDGLWFDNAGHPTITTDGHSGEGLEYTWSFVDDGELLATAGTNPYIPDVFKKNDVAMADYELELTVLEAQGYTIAPVSFLKHVLETRKIPKTPIAPPVLDGSWQPKGSDNMHLWMGGTGQEPGSERDNEINTLNVSVSRRIAAAVALRERLTTEAPEGAAALDLDAIDKALRAAQRELALGEVSDATGWRPLHTEVGYGLRHSKEAGRIADAVARHCAWWLGYRTGQVQVDVDTGQVMPIGEPAPSTPLDGPPAGLEAIAVTSDRPHTMAWSDHGAFVELTIVHPATETRATGTVPPPRIAVELPFSSPDIAYSPAVAETVLLRAPHASYAVLNGTSPRLGLPLVNGLLELAPGRTLVLDQATIHLAALIARDRVTFEDLGFPGEQQATWTFRFYDKSANEVLDAANALNGHRPAVFNLDAISP